MVRALIFIFIGHTYLYFQHRALHRFWPKGHAIHHKHIWLKFHLIEELLNWSTFLVGWLLGFSAYEMLPLYIWGVLFTYYAHVKDPKIPDMPKCLTPYLTSLSYHHKHHKLYSVNYGVFLTFWDKALETSE